MALIVKSDERAFYELYMRYREKVLGACIKEARDFSLAEEAANLVWLRAWTKASQYRGDAAVSSWLYRIALNEVRMIERTQRKHKKHLEAISKYFKQSDYSKGINFNTPQKNLERRESFELYRDSVRDLREDYRKSVYLQNIEMYNSAEAAAIIGISYPCQKTRYHRGRYYMRDHFGYEI